MTIALNVKHYANVCLLYFLSHCLYLTFFDVYSTDVRLVMVLWTWHCACALLSVQYFHPLYCTFYMCSFLTTSLVSSSRISHFQWWSRFLPIFKNVCFCF